MMPAGSPAFQGNRATCAWGGGSVNLRRYMHLHARSPASKTELHMPFHECMHAANLCAENTAGVVA
eukprot:scaffold57438_cov31-Tisochrysis_lutea.AAC.1